MEDNKSTEIVNEHISEEELIEQLLTPIDDKNEMTDNSDGEIGYNKEENSIAKEILIFLRDLVVIVVVFFLFTSFISERTVVDGDSMEPSIQDGDWIYINKIGHRFSKPDRFDIIVFPYPQDPGKNYIKRIIGLPGEVINIDSNTGDIYINNELLEEDFGNEAIRLRTNITFPFTIPEGEYFVLGDNRNNSHDSRVKDVGTISKEDIIGEAGLRVWPLNNIGFID